jgi:hypothetical protein
MLDGDEDDGTFACIRCGARVYHAASECSQCGLELYPEGDTDDLPEMADPTARLSWWQRVLGRLRGER